MRDGEQRLNLQKRNTVLTVLEVFVMAKLALKGGEAVAPEGVKTMWPIFSEEEREALLEVLESGRWWRGAYKNPKDSKVGQFGSEFCKYLGVKYGVVVTNGTAAIELALKAAGVEAGTRLLCQL